MHANSARRVEIKSNFTRILNKLSTEYQMYPKPSKTNLGKNIHFHTYILYFNSYLLVRNVSCMSLIYLIYLCKWPKFSVSLKTTFERTVVGWINFTQLYPYKNVLISYIFAHSVIGWKIMTPLIDGIKYNITIFSLLWENPFRSSSMEYSFKNK